MSGAVFSRRKALALTTGLSVLGIPGLRLRAEPKVLDPSFFAEMTLAPGEVRQVIEPLWASGELSRDPLDLTRKLLRGSTLQSDALRDHIKSQISEDFANGDTIRVGGWILSRTETLLWALYALIAAPGV